MDTPFPIHSNHRDYVRCMAIVIAGILIVLALIHLWHNWRIQPHSLYLSGAIAAIAVVFVSYYFFIYGQSVVGLAVTFGHFTPIHLLMGPLLLFYVRAVLSDNHRLRGIDGLHFIPAGLDLVFRISFFMVPWETKLWMAGEMIRDPNRLHDFSHFFYPSPTVALTLRLLSMIGYTGSCLWMVRRFQASRPQLRQIPPKAAGTVIRFLTHLLMVCLVAELSFFALQVIFLTQRDLTTGYILSSPLMIIALIGILSIPIIIQLHPEVLYGIPRWREHPYQEEIQGSAPSSSSAKPETDDVGADAFEGKDRFYALALRINEVLTAEQPYLDPEFSLDDLARLMDVPKHHLYYCFNQILQKKFTQIRAEYRIGHARRLIDEGQTRDKTLEAIGLESGFTSRSSFISAFREMTGKLPSAYLEDLQKSRAGQPEEHVP